MNLTDPGYLKAMLAKHGASPKHALGQHFLVSEKVVSTIVNEALPASGVLEIGPGPGVLTSPISMRVSRMIALEIDEVMRGVLTETAPAADVRNVDALQTDLREILASLPRPRAIVSNLPYYITGPLLGRIGDAVAEWDWAVLMMQKEVGERILAPAGDSDRGSLSIWIQSEFSVRRIAVAPAGAFYPPPRVDSVVLRLDPKISGRPQAFFGFVRGGFTQPRKTLANNLKGMSVDPALVEKAGLSPTIRPHQLEIEQWDRLFSLV